jgi:membrane-bound lytic murein transglycosylase B
LTGTTYASATIAADRGQRSFGLSLDQFLAKRGASAIVARGRALKQSNAALFASIQQRYGVPPGPLLAIWGMETAFGSQRGNQNTLAFLSQRLVRVVEGTMLRTLSMQLLVKTDPSLT